MLDTLKFLEKFLQQWRFRKAIPYLSGRVLDFGGNRGELKDHILVKEEYFFTNDIFHVRGKWDNIACLAVLEHMSYSVGAETLLMLYSHLESHGTIVVTTPSKILHPVLRVLAWCGLLDRKNIEEHKHYWNKREFQKIANALKINMRYERFQFGLNQLVVLEKE
jgi:hypothetical protein